jgi:plastocyanin
MMNILLPAAMALVFIAGGHAMAAGLTAEVSDQSGQAVQDAVVSLTPDTSDAAPGDAAPAQDLVIDQRDETFVPFVTLIRRGGRVTFTNSDKTQHHVYSFSPIKRFQFLLNPGEKSEPVAFERTGVAAIGCNIHDHMVTYVYVAESNLAALTDAQGRARIENISVGRYVAKVWHPRLKPGSQAPAESIAISGQAITLSLTAPLFAKQELEPHRRRYE